MSKIFLFQVIYFSQTLLIQTIQFSIRIVFVHTQLIVKTVLFQTIQLSVSTVSMSKAVLFRVIQFSISTQFSSIWPIVRTLSGATTPGESGPGSDSNERILQHYWYITIRLFSVISRTLIGRGLTPQQRCSQYILQPMKYTWYNPNVSWLMRCFFIYLFIILPFLLFGFKILNSNEDVCTAVETFKDLNEDVCTAEQLIL